MQTTSGVFVCQAGLQQLMDQLCEINEMHGMNA